MNSSNNKVIKKIINNGITTSVAESCTGGLLSSKITNIPGASKVFYLGLIVYSNKSKFSILKIPNKLINKYGAVSIQTIKQMVYKLYKKTNSPGALV